MKNNTFEEIGKILSQGKRILIFPHINMDGDALGSAAALCAALRKSGKECFVLIEDDIPANLKFLDKGYCTKDAGVLRKADISICVDCGNEGRFPMRKKKFKESHTSICLDHHATTEAYCQYNYVDSKASATAEIVYKLLKSMNAEIDKDIAEAIFAGITTDTGNFQYSNTTEESHLITAELRSAGLDFNEVSVKIYENVRLEKLLLRNKVLNTLTIVAGGRGAIAYVTEEMLKETGALMEETEGMVQELRSIRGVEVAAFLKESGNNEVKISLRSKSEVDVAQISAQLGGGGHRKAAGCTIQGSLTEAYDLIKEKVAEALEEL